jgi:hypothetical protein
MKIDSVGHAPWMVERVRMTISLRNTRLTKATVLDANGYATGTKALQPDARGLLHLTLPEDALHVVLE